MKIICLKENLSKALSLASKIIPVKPSLPILGNVLLQTEKGMLKISSTNLEIGIICKIGAKINEEGSITVPAKLFTEYINTIPDEKVEISVNDLDIEIVAGKYNAKIKGLPSSDFPLIPLIDVKPSLKIDANLLAEALPYVSFSVSVDESRPILNGVLFDFFQDKIKLVSTDSYRLSEKIIEVKTDIKENISVVVPQKAVQELLRMLSEINEELEVLLTEEQILFKTTNIELTSRLIEGKYPDYEQIIPESWQTKLTLNRNEFISAIKTVSLFAREAAGNIKLEANKGGGLVVKSMATQIGEAQSIVDAQAEGEEIEIAFNAKYLLDVLNVLESETVVCLLNGSLNPAVIRGETEKDYTHIIMPLRI